MTSYNVTLINMSVTPAESLAITVKDPQTMANIKQSVKQKWPNFNVAYYFKLNNSTDIKVADTALVSSFLVAGRNRLTIITEAIGGQS